MKHPDSPVTFSERMQRAKDDKRAREAATPVVPQKRAFTPVRKPAVIPEHKGVLAPLVLPDPKPVVKP